MGHLLAEAKYALGTHCMRILASTSVVPFKPTTVQMPKNLVLIETKRITVWNDFRGDAGDTV
jgi:hypothetical protein